jgi:hypothetical protein
VDRVVSRRIVEGVGRQSIDRRRLRSPLSAATADRTMLAPSGWHIVSVRDRCSRRDKSRRDFIQFPLSSPAATVPHPNIDGPTSLLADGKMELISPAGVWSQ